MEKMKKVIHLSAPDFTLCSKEKNENLNRFIDRRLHLSVARRLHGEP
jgi:hypothetical protein